LKGKFRMLIVFGVLGLAAVGLIIYWLLRVNVGESRLQIMGEGTHFPIVSGNNLDRQEFEFPRDFAGDLNLVIIPFQQQQQLDVNTWIPAAQELERAYPGLVYYELPTIYQLPQLSRTFINEGMRAGIPDQTARERTITLYLDKATFREALGISSEEEISIFLVDRQGNILWNEKGLFSEGKAQRLIEAIQHLRP
jgi:hypothetical protein